MASAPEPTQPSAKPRSKLAGRPRAPVKSLPPLEALRRWLSYDPATGIMRWKARKSPMAPAGAEAGNISRDGYRTIYFDGITYLAHRLAWLLHYGFPPAGQMDHINGVRSDNRIENLRLATPSQNCANRRVNPSSKCGIKGVRQCKLRGKWRAYVSISGRRTYLGHFATAEEANRAYSAAAVRAHGEFARPSIRATGSGQEPDAPAAMRFDASIRP